MLKRYTTQRESIKQFLLSGNSITALEALSLFGAYRLAAHIEVLRNRDGLGIVTEMNKDITGRTYARYSWSKERQDSRGSFYAIPHHQSEIAYAS